MGRPKDVPCDAQVVVRMPKAMVERIDLVVDRMRLAALEKGDREWKAIQRSDAIRAILDGGLPPLPVLGATIG